MAGKRRQRQDPVKKYVRLEKEYATATQAEIGNEIGTRLDHLADIADAGAADFAASELMRLAEGSDLPQGSLGRSRLEHQAGVAFSLTRAGARHEAVVRSQEMLTRAYRSRPRKRYPRPWGETALHLAHGYREIGRHTGGAERESALVHCERLLNEAQTAFERLGLIGAFHKASATLSLGNLIADGGDKKRSRRMLRAASKLIERRVARFGWHDPTYQKPKRLYAAVSSSMVAGLLREGSATSLKAAEGDLQHALTVVDDPRVRFRLAQAHALSGTPDQSNLDALASPSTFLALHDEELLAAADLISQGEPTRAAEDFFRDVIARLSGVRASQYAHHTSDFTAQRIDHFARHWARMIASSDPDRAFAVVETHTSLRMQEAVRLHRWHPANTEEAALNDELSVFSELASVFDGWGALVGSMPSDLRPKFMRAMRERIDPNGAGHDPTVFGDPSAIAADRIWEQWQQLDKAVSSEQALRDRAIILAKQAEAARGRLEQLPGFNEAHESLPPFTSDEMRFLLREIGKVAFFRMELFDDAALALYADIDPASGELRTLAYDIPGIPDALSRISIGQFWQSGEISPDALDHLRQIPIFAGLPRDTPPRIIVLPSARLALFPLLAIGPPAQTLLDRFEAVQFAWSLASIRIRPAAGYERSGTLELYPGRERPYAGRERTFYHAIASSSGPGEQSTDLGSDASLDKVATAWMKADIVSFYGHGEHVLMGHPGIPPGPQLLLGRGECLGMSALQWKTHGLSRVELWACRSGIDFPWDPMFPGGIEGFGFDYELIRSGVQSTIGTLWSVDELITSLIVLRYRVGLGAGKDAALALADAQRWWRDRGRIACTTATELVDGVCAAWEDALDGTPPDDAARGVCALLARKDHDRLRESLANEIAHAAYRFSGHLHEPTGAHLEARPSQQPDNRDIEVRRLAPEELRMFSIPRAPPPQRELAGFHDSVTDCVGVILFDDYDRNFDFFLLKCASPDDSYCLARFQLDIAKRQDAEAELLAAMATHREET